MIYGENPFSHLLPWSRVTDKMTSREMVSEIAIRSSLLTWYLPRKKLKPTFNVYLFWLCEKNNGVRKSFQAYCRVKVATVASAGRDKDSRTYLDTQAISPGLKLRAPLLGSRIFSH